MQITGADAHQPGLGVRATGPQAVTGGEFVFGYRLVAGEETAGQKEHVSSQNYENNASHNQYFGQFLSVRE